MIDSTFSQRSDADSPCKLVGVALRNGARQLPGRPASLPGVAMHSGHSEYPRNASIMPGNSFMFHYRSSLLLHGRGLPLNWKVSGNFLESFRCTPRKWKLSVNILEIPGTLAGLADKWQTHPRFCLPL